MAGLIETWDVLKSLQSAGKNKSATRLIETWDVLKLFHVKHFLRR